MTESNILPYDGEAILIDDHGAECDWPAITRWLIDTIPWQVETARIFGREMPIPRMTAWPLPENVGVKYLMQVVSNRIKAAANSNERIHQFYFSSRYAERRADSSICDFTFGNPHEMPLRGLVDAIRRHAIPLNKTGSHTKQVKPSRKRFWPSA